MKLLTKTIYKIDLDESLRFDTYGIHDHEVHAEALELSTHSSSLIAKGREVDVNGNKIDGGLHLAIEIDIAELPQNVAVAVLEAVLNA